MSSAAETTAIPGSTEPTNPPPLPSHLDPQTYPRTKTDPTRNTHLALTYSPLDPTTVLKSVSSPSAGANVLFLGTTRNSFDNRPVTQLSYTTYPPLAMRTLERIAEEAVETHSLLGVSIVHRIGAVPVGEASIAVAVSSAHRGPAWRAGEEVLERCKERLEVWKREEFGDRLEDGNGNVSSSQWKANRDWDSEGKRRKVSP